MVTKKKLFFSETKPPPNNRHTRKKKINNLKRVTEKRHYIFGELCLGCRKAWKLKARYGLKTGSNSANAADQ